MEEEIPSHNENTFTLCNFVFICVFKSLLSGLPTDFGMKNMLVAELKSNIQ